MMGHPHIFTASLLEQTGSAYAGMSADELTRSSPDLAAKYSAEVSAGLRDFVFGLVRELASSVRSRRPDLFAKHAAWQREAFASRGLPLSDLVAALETLEIVLSRELPPSGATLAREHMTAALEEVRTASVKPDASLIDPSTPLGQLAGRYVLRLLEGSRREASDLILRAIDEDGVAAVDVYEHVLTPAQQEIGRLWHVGELSVAEEHFVTATTDMVLSQVYTRLVKAPMNGYTLLAGALEGNTHTIGLRVISDLFDADGWRVIYLGADVPSADFVQAVADFTPDLVALTASLATHRAETRRLIHWIRTSAQAGDLGVPPELPVLVGGRAFEQDDAKLIEEVGADAGTSSVHDAVRVGRSLVERTHQASGTDRDSGVGA